MPPQPRPGEMWTEITKYLVCREAIRRFGYEYKETEQFYDIMEYLRQVGFRCPFVMPTMSTNNLCRRMFSNSSIRLMTSFEHED